MFRTGPVVRCAVRQKGPLNQTAPNPGITNPTIFPLILTWLVELDTSPRGADGQFFARYADMISNEGYYRLCGLAGSMTADNLKSACPGILDGVARTLLRYATTDVRRIRDKAGKNCKHAKKQDQA